MSTDYYVHCTKCGESSEGFHSSISNKLEAAIKESFYVYLLARSGWDLSGVQYEGWVDNGLARFLANHYECRSFVVRCEYYYADPIRYPDVSVEAWEPVLLTQGAYI